MKLAITAQDRLLNAPLDERFGRALYFLIGDSETDTFQAYENAGRFSTGGAGIAAAQMLVDQGVQAVITGRVGPNAAQVLQDAGISIYSGNAGTAQAALDAFREGRLASITEPTADLHAGLQEDVKTNNSVDTVLAIALTDDRVCEHFGHCMKFALVTIRDGDVIDQQTIPNPGHEPGILPGYLAERGANVVIAGGMGTRAVDLFKSRGITCILGVSGRLPEIVEAFKAGSLQGGDSLCDH